MALPPVPPRAVTDQTRCLLAPNPGPMTLDGTNSYVLGRVGGPVAVVDPGPQDERHLAGLVAAGEVTLILITHRHVDHTEAAPALHRMTGAPVRAADPEHCHGGRPLVDGERFAVGGVRIQVVGTPGHTDDSVSFLLPDDGPTGSVLTGDTILGRGTTVIAHPDGNLADYLATLDILQALGPARVLPAHGPQREDLVAVVGHYREHRLQRLEQIRVVLADLGDDVTVDRVVDTVYVDTPPQVRSAAVKSVTAQLEYLRAGPQPR